MKPTDSQRELLLRHIDGRLSSAERGEVADLLRADADARAFVRELAEQAVMIADLERAALGRAELEQERVVVRPRPQTFGPGVRKLLALAAVVVIVLGVSLLLRPAGKETGIVTVSGLNGAVQWIGNGGQVVHVLNPGDELAGGTIEGLTPFAWLELTFRDGSTVAVSGNSSITFADDGQKRLHLKEGSVSAKVRPQPEGRPLMVHTRSAVLEVLGTQFEVETELAATMLNVSEGSVRVRRISDGATVDVPARHRVVAAVDRTLTAERVPPAVHRWRSELPLGPQRTLGRWLPGTAGESPRLGAVPFITQQGKTIHTVGFGISSGDRVPVTLRADARIRVRGRLDVARPVYVGVTVRHRNGQFAGRFQVVRPAGEFNAGQPFDIFLGLGDFQLDPGLGRMKEKFPSRPDELVVESAWCHTLYERAGLEIVGIELGDPEAHERR